MRLTHVVTWNGLTKVENECLTFNIFQYHSDLDLYYITLTIRFIANMKFIFRKDFTGKTIDFNKIIAIKSFIFLDFNSFKLHQLFAHKSFFPVPRYHFKEFLALVSRERTNKKSTKSSHLSTSQRGSFILLKSM